MFYLGLVFIIFCIFFNHDTFAQTEIDQTTEYEIDFLEHIENSDSQAQSNTRVEVTFIRWTIKCSNETFILSYQNKICAAYSLKSFLLKPAFTFYRGEFEDGPYTFILKNKLENMLKGELKKNTHIAKIQEDIQSSTLPEGCELVLSEAHSYSRYHPDHNDFFRFLDFTHDSVRKKAKAACRKYKKNTIQPQRIF